MLYKCQDQGDRSAAQRRLIKQDQDRWKGPLLHSLMVQNLMATAFYLNSDNFLLDTFSVFVELSLDPVTHSSFVSQPGIYLFATYRNYLKVYTNLLSFRFLLNTWCTSALLRLRVCVWENGPCDGPLEMNIDVLVHCLPLSITGRLGILDTRGHCI